MYILKKKKSNSNYKKIIKNTINTIETLRIVLINFIHFIYLLVFDLSLNSKRKEFYNNILFMVDTFQFLFFRV